MKIAFVHYNFGHDGVTRVVLNNIKGIKKKHPEFEVTLLAGGFDLNDSELYEKRLLKDLKNHEIPRTSELLHKKAQEIYKKLTNFLKDFDLVIIENPTIGLFPIQTVAFKKLAEENLNVVYRIHDLIEDKRHPLGYFKSMNKNYADLIYPKKTKYLVINSHYLERLGSILPLDLNLLSDSIVPEDFILYRHDRVKSFREKLIEDKIIRPDEKIILYPVRIIMRKNIEEALLITMIMNYIKKDKHRLIITMKEERFLKDRIYLNKLKSLAKQKKINCVLGGINTRYKFYGESGHKLKEGEYKLKDLFAVSDVIITTSLLEGFGYCFLEPFLVEKPLIGRSLKYAEEDFENAGVDLSNLYAELKVFNKKYGKITHAERMSIIEYISNNQLDKIIKDNNLKEKLDYENKSRVIKNKEKIIEMFNYIDNAELLLNLCKDKIKPQHL